MIRRTLQFVLMLAVLLSTSAAQAYAMPCCQISSVAAAPAVAVSAIAAADEATTMHCHGMSNVSATVHLLSLTKCPSPVCGINAEAATAATEDAALLPLMHAVAGSLSSVAVLSGSLFTAHNGQAYPPDPPRHAIVPLRV
jgi:hypothetical protein